MFVLGRKIIVLPSNQFLQKFRNSVFPYFKSVVQIPLSFKNESPKNSTEKYLSFIMLLKIKLISINIILIFYTKTI